MPSLLHYGVDSVLKVAAAHVALSQGASDSSSLSPDAVVTAATEALQQPIGFPALRLATVPGDRVTVALEPGTQAAEELCTAVVGQLLAAGVLASDITILRSQADVDAGAPDPRGRLPQDQAAAVQLVVHRPEARGELAYLGPTMGSEGIYLNRLLGDADLVVPVGCFRPTDEADHVSPAGLYPAFADAKAQARFLALELPDNASHAAAGRREAAEAIRLLGAPFRALVIPGDGGGAQAVLAGEAQAVSQQAGEMYDAIWRRNAQSRAPLVVAGVSGAACQQTWENVGRAAAAASRLVTENGAIAICCELSAAPGPALTRSGTADDPYAALRRLRKQPPADLLTALRFARVRETARIFLLSRLEETVVEELGMAAASDPDDITRLIARSAACILLPDAQFAVVTVEDNTS